MIMTASSIKHQAQKVLMDTLNQGDGEFKGQVEIAPKDGTMLVFLPLADGLDDPIDLLRKNGNGGRGASCGAVVVNPRTGKPAMRHVIPLRIWSKTGRLRDFLAGDTGTAPPSSLASMLRLLKGIPAGLSEYAFGPAGSLTLFPDNHPPLLATQIWPGGLAEAGVRESSCLRSMGWVLLARSGVASWPFHFHMLRKKAFFQIERATAIRSGHTNSEALKAIQDTLIHAAEEDRKILNAMLGTGFFWNRNKERELTLTHQSKEE